MPRYTYYHKAEVCLGLQSMLGLPGYIQAVRLYGHGLKSQYKAVDAGCCGTPSLPPHSDPPSPPRCRSKALGPPRVSSLLPTDICFLAPFAPSLAFFFFFFSRFSCACLRFGFLLVLPWVVGCGFVVQDPEMRSQAEAGQQPQSSLPDFLNAIWLVSHLPATSSLL